MESYTILLIGAALCLGGITTPTRAIDGLEEAKAMIVADLLTETLCREGSQEFLQYVLKNQQCSGNSGAFGLALDFFKKVEKAKVEVILAKIQYLAVLVTRLEGGVAGSNGLQVLDWDGFMRVLQIDRAFTKFFQRMSFQILGHVIRKMFEVDKSSYIKKAFYYLIFYIKKAESNYLISKGCNATSTGHSSGCTSHTSSEQSTGSSEDHSSGSSEGDSSGSSEGDSSGSSEGDSSGKSSGKGGSSGKSKSGSSKKSKSGSSKKSKSGSSKKHKSGSSEKSKS